jgi:Flp pilus assembly protein TadD
MGQAKKRQGTDAESPKAIRWIWWLMPVTAVAVTAIFMISRQSKPIAVPLASIEAPAPILLPEDQVHAGYVGSESCKACHAAEFEKWKTSNHHFAERQVVEGMDHAAFAPGRTISHGTQTSEAKLDEKGLAQLVTTGLGNVKQPYTIRRVIGHDPLRQFLVDGPGSRMQTLELAFDPHKSEWFNVYGKEDRQPGEWGHWTGRGMNWNAQCASCHNTRVRKNYDSSSDSYRTTMVEQSIGCESCHGPMKEHVDWQGKKPAVGTKDPTVKKQTKEQMLATCGACHARRGELSGDLVPGDSFYDHFTLSIPDGSDLFHPDGQIHEEDYELTAFMGSKMHAAGVSCENCHDPHTGKRLAEGNALCMRCHSGTPQPGISKPAPAINPITHSHHGDASPGNLCTSCHMPVTTYMQRHPRHDHGFTIPDPKLTKDHGIPNACNRCHTDKDAAWAQQSVEAWYGAKMERPTRARTTLFAKARAGRPEAREGLIAFLKQPNEPLWQASASLLLGSWADDEAASGALVSQLKHPHPMVREAAVRSLGPVSERFEKVLKPLLDDPSRNVRVAAAWAMVATVDPDSKAGKELLHMLSLSADQPTGQMQLGQYEFSRGNTAEAIAHFRKAVEWDSGSPPFHHDLAIALSSTGDSSGAIRELQAAIKLAPENAEYHYKLALAWNEAGSLPNAIAALETTVKLDPGMPRAWFNLAAAYSRNGNRTNAMQAAQQAAALNPTDPEVMQLLQSLRPPR